MIYIPATISVYKDNVCLFETDCECGVDYDLDDGAADWDVNEFWFDDTKDGKKVYTKINRHEPLFHVLYGNLNREWLEQRLYDALATDGIYAEA